MNSRSRRVGVFQLLTVVVIAAAGWLVAIALIVVTAEPNSVFLIKCIATLKFVMDAVSPYVSYVAMLMSRNLIFK
jgi:hypothetical protein